MQKNDLIRNFFTKRQAICERYLSAENVSESDLRACEREVLGLTRATIRAGLYEIIPMLGNTPGMYNSLAALREFDRYIPDNLRYGITLAVAINAKEPIPRNLILKMKQHRPYNYLDSLPECYQGKDSLHVYRATVEADPAKVRYEVCWTLDRGVAEAFRTQIAEERGEPVYIYEADIDPRKIIAYCDDRSEAEVLQHGAVRNVQMCSARPM